MCRTLTQAAQQEVMSTIHALRPAALHHVGLFEAVRTYVARWSQQHQIAAKVDCQGQSELPLPVEQDVFRVAQEALTNIARHSEATQVTIRLSADRRSGTLSIANNGRGFDPQATAQHGIGLQSMRERVAAYGGTLMIDSWPGAGTRMIAYIPLPTEDRDA